ncbi:MAG: hypothetical protein WBM98_00945 [Maribacter sp.]|uniref:hypothetical protein n=1 Tax=Maribacter sp. TaxID=1897614 RepID=UPI003C71AEE9
MQQRNGGIDPIKIQINRCPFFIYGLIDSLNEVFGQIGVFELMKRSKVNWHTTKKGVQKVSKPVSLSAVEDLKV